MKRKFLLTTIIILSLLTACGKKDAAGEPVNTDTEENDRAVISEASIENADSDDSGDAKEDALNEIELTLFKNSIETEDIYFPEKDEDYCFPYAYVNYMGFDLSDENFEKYPKLSQTLEDWTYERHEAALDALASGWQQGCEMAEEGYEYFYESNYDIWDISIERADDTAVSALLINSAYYNGIHPSTWYCSFFIDTQSGEFLPLEDVVDDMFALPQVILDNLEPVVDDSVLTDEDLETIKPTIEEMVSDGDLVWTMDDDSFNVYFDAYDLMYYAFGDIIAQIPYKDYPSLFNEKYIPDGKSTPISERIDVYENDTTIYSEEDLEQIYISSGLGGESEGYMNEVECPDWEVPYLADGIFDEQTSDEITVTEISKEKVDVLEMDNWIYDKGISLIPSLYYKNELSEDGWWFYATNMEPDILRLEVVYEDYDIGTFEFSGFLNPPIPSDEFADLQIAYAKVVDDVLYAEISHRTYASSQPYTAYIVAVDTTTGKLLWKSEYLVANAENFCINGGVIICGYGFTAEKDYLYVLSRESGATLKKISLDTAPYHIIPKYDGFKDGLFYVTTYDTAYEFEISFG